MENNIPQPQKQKNVLKRVLLFVVLPIILVGALVFTTFKFLLPNNKNGDNTPATSDTAQTQFTEKQPENQTLFKYKTLKYSSYYCREMMGDFAYTNWEYDQSGNILSEIHTDNGVNLFDKIIYEYDQNGNVTLITKSDENGNITAKEVNTYDNNGNLTSKFEYDELNNINNYVYTYNENGKCISIESYKNGCSAGVIRYEYDVNGKITLIDYPPDELADTKYEYDANGNLIKQILLHDNSQIANITTFDANGYHISNISYDENGNITSKVESIYDDHMRPILSKDFYINQTPQEKITEYKYKYDGNGNVIEKIHTNQYDVPITWKYTYDSNNNLLTAEEHTPYEDWYGNVTIDIVKYESQYDSMGNIILLTRTNTSGEKSTLYKAEYNQEGNPLFIEHHIGNNAQTQIYDYEKGTYTYENTMRDKDGVEYYREKYEYSDMITFETNTPEKSDYTKNQSLAYSVWGQNIDKTNYPLYKWWFTVGEYDPN